MAIIKETEKETGVKVSYWNIQSYNIKYVKDEGYYGTITLQGYLDKKARLSGKTLIETQQHPIDLYFKPDKLMISSLYTYVKTLGDFLGAEDDL